MSSRYRVYPLKPATRCERCAGPSPVVVSHWAKVDSWAYSQPLCAECAELMERSTRTRPRHLAELFQYDYYLPIVKPGACPVVDDMVARFCAEVCAYGAVKKKKRRRAS